MPFDKYGFLGKQIDEISDNIYREHKDFFDIAFELNAFANLTKHTLSANNKNGQQVISACLFIKILNGFQSVVLLLRKGLISEGKIITRTILESLFILKTICEDEEATQKYVITDEAKREKLLNIVLDKTKADIFESIRENINPFDLERLKKENKARGVKDISAWDWADKSKLLSHYETAYRVLSDEVHSTPRSLENYVQVNEKGDINAFDCRPQTKDLNRTLSTACIVLVMALESINELFAVNCSEQIQKFADEIIGRYR